ncbi:DUF192 domain-containing protein [Candidatus Woesearchaeota archaeon]|nr:DUF192 domain-containing protein [Candidatus Woesearchaeota archaeon]
MEYEIVEGAFGKARGLMFSKKKNLIFVFHKERRVGLHMFFVFFPIDVLFLDEDKKIIEIKKNFKPFRFYKSKKKAKYVVEISEKNNFNVGESFSF